MLENESSPLAVTHGSSCRSATSRRDRDCLALQDPRACPPRVESGTGIPEGDDSLVPFDNGGGHACSAFDGHQGTGRGGPREERRFALRQGGPGSRYPRRSESVNGNALVSAGIDWRAPPIDPENHRRLLTRLASKPDLTMRALTAEPVAHGIRAALVRQEGGPHIRDRSASSRART